MLLIVIGIVFGIAAMDKYRRMLDYYVELQTEVERISTELNDLKQSISQIKLIDVDDIKKWGFVEDSLNSQYSFWETALELYERKGAKINVA